MKPSKKVVAVAVPDKNSAKYFSYREAWGRIRRAQGHGYYFEAVTLEESIIADRLLSFLVRVGAVDAGTRHEKWSFGQLIRLWTNFVSEPIPTKYFPDLRVAIDEWRCQRNKVVHGIVKSYPGQYRGDVLDFLKEAKLAAIQGDALACALTEWCRKQKQSQALSADKK